MNARQRGSDDADVDSGRGIGGSDDRVEAKMRNRKRPNLHIKCVAVKGIAGFVCGVCCKSHGNGANHRKWTRFIQIRGRRRKEEIMFRTERKELCKNRSEEKTDFVVVHGDSVEVIMNKWKLRFGECDTFPSSG